VRNAQQSIHLVAATVGFLSLFLLWLAVLWGLMLRNGWAQSRIKHATVYGIHQTIALLGVMLGVVHGFTQLAGPMGTVKLVDVVVPFTNPYDPIGIGVGVISLELFVACTLSVLIQKKLGYTRWRALHAFNYVAYMFLVGHVLMSGSEMAAGIRWGAVLGSFVITVLLWMTTTQWFINWRQERTNRRNDRAGVGDELLVNVDGNRCARFGFCEHEAPKVFALRGDGRLAYKATVPPDLANDVIRAVEVCPARAIQLHRTATTVVTQKNEEPAEQPLTGPTRIPAGSGAGPRRRSRGDR
jgi:sulfoxide reductase heme-binding subunit YedZ